MRKILLCFLVIVGLLVGLSGPACAVTIDFFTLGSGAKLPNQVYISPKTYAGIDLRGPFGELFDGSGWAVAQWGPGQPLTEILDCQGSCTDGVWKLSSADGRSEERRVGRAGSGGTEGW